MYAEFSGDPRPRRTINLGGASTSNVSGGVLERTRHERNERERRRLREKAVVHIQVRSLGSSRIICI